MKANADLDKLKEKADLVEKISQTSYFLLMITIVAIWCFSRNNIANVLLILILALSSVALITNMISAILHDKLRKDKK